MAVLGKNVRLEELPRSFLRPLTLIELWIMAWALNQGLVIDILDLDDPAARRHGHLTRQKNMGTLSHYSRREN